MDEALREAERAWSTSGDPDDLERLIAAYRRGGARPPGRLLDQRLRPARTLISQSKLRVMAMLPGESPRSFWEHCSDDMRQEPPHFPWRRIESVGKLPNKVELPAHHLAWVGVTAQELEKRPQPKLLEALRDLQPPGVNLGDLHVTDEQVAALCQLEGLETLLLDRCQKLTDAVLDALPDRLRCLTLSSRHFTDDGLQALERCEDLTFLHLGNGYSKHRPLSGAALGCVRRLPQLTHLSVRDLKNLKKADLEPLAELQQLEQLHLRHTGRLTLAQLKPLESLPNLTHLELEAQYKPKDVAKLARLENLTHLFLSHGPLCEDIEALRPLQSLPLQWLDVRGMLELYRKADHEAVQAMFPEATVITDGEWPWMMDYRV